MKIKVEIEDTDLLGLHGIAELLCEQNGLTLDSVDGSSATFSNPDSENYGYPRYRVDLKAGYAEHEDNGEWRPHGEEFDCPVGNDWSDVVFVKAEDGTEYAVCP